MSIAIDLTLVAAAVGLTFLARRRGFPFYELAALALMTAMVAPGFGRFRTITLILLLPTSWELFGFRIPGISSGGGRRDGGIPQGNHVIGERARVVTGIFQSRWPSGELKLARDRLTFVTDTGRELFQTRVSLIDSVVLGRWGRSDLTVETRDGERFKVALGRETLRGEERRAAQEFWHATIADRQRTSTR